MTGALGTKVADTTPPVLEVQGDDPLVLGYLDTWQDPGATATDLVDGIGFDTGLPPLNAQGRREFIDTGLTDGFPYVYSVISYSAANPVLGLGELSSSLHDNLVEVYPGPGPADPADWGGVGVYPNPYRAASLFDERTGRSVEKGRHIWFTGLPARSRIRIYTVAGDVVRTIEHDDPNTGQHDWDVLSDYGRVSASGLYIFSVEDLTTGEVRRGKLVIIK